MANIPVNQPGNPDIGTDQGGAPDVRKETSLNEVGRPHYTRVERKRPNPILQPNSAERGRLSRDPNWNQAGNERGSEDSTSGSQTGNDLIE